MSETRERAGDILDRLTALHPRKIDLTLDRMWRVLDRLGNPQNALPPIIHVAGTNGKGSVLAYLKAMLQAAGKRVHTYSSPHLVRFNERIELAGAPISNEALSAVLAEVEALNAGEPITFFEVTTAAALLAFSRAPADALILEVGLGGRLDATNVIDNPAVSVITPVYLDHQDFLGATLGQIAFEKAGILKPGVTGIIGPQSPEAQAVIEARAGEVGAPLRFYGTDFIAHEEQGRYIYQDTDGLMDLPLPRLEGGHQIENAAVAIAAAKAFVPVSFTPEQLATGLRTATWPGRMQRLKEGPLVASIGGEGGQQNAPDLWIDGGHNPGAARVVAQAMADLDERLSRPLYIIAGMGKNKDAQGFFKPFVGLARRVFTVPMPDDHEGYSPRELAAEASGAGLNASIASNVADGIAEAMADAKDGETPRILITGSLYLIGTVLAENK